MSSTFDGGRPEPPRLPASARIRRQCAPIGGLLWLITAALIAGEHVGPLWHNVLWP